MATARSQVFKLVTACLNRGYAISVYSEEGLEDKNLTKHSEIMDWYGELELTTFRLKKDKKGHGVFQVVAEEGIIDYSDNDLCNEIYNELPEVD